MSHLLLQFYLLIDLLVDDKFVITLQNTCLQYLINYYSERRREDSERNSGEEGARGVSSPERKFRC